MKKLLAVFGLLLTLNGCDTDQPPPPRANFGLPQKMVIDVQAINLADRSGMQPANSPYNSNHYSPTITDAIKQWAGDRLQAGGQTGQAIIVIKEASLVAQPLPKLTGIDGWFTRQQDVKYIGHAEVSIEATGRAGFALADAVATRAVTLPEDATPAEKQEAYYTLLNGLMKDLGQNLESGIQTHMGGFLMGGSQVYSGNAGPSSEEQYAGGPDQNQAPVIIQSPVTPQYANAPNNGGGYSGQNGGPQYGGLQYGGSQYAGSQYGGPQYGGPQYGGSQGQSVQTYNDVNQAVADAAISSPPPVQVSNPTMAVSQNNGNYGNNYGGNYGGNYGSNYGGNYGNNTSGGPNLTMSAGSGAPVSVYPGASAAPIPGSVQSYQLPPQAQNPVQTYGSNAPNNGMQNGYGQQTTISVNNAPSPSYSGNYDNTNSYNYAPQQQAAPSNYNANGYGSNNYASTQSQNNYQNNYNAAPSQPSVQTYNTPPSAPPSQNSYYANNYQQNAPQPLSNYGNANGSNSTSVSTFNNYGPATPPQQPTYNAPYTQGQQAANSNNYNGGYNNGYGAPPPPPVPQGPAQTIPISGPGYRSNYYSR